MDVADPVPVTSDKFSRLAAVLGALDSSGPSSVKCSAVNGQPAAAWSLNRGGVFRAGRDPEDSSDEGEADQHGRQELLPGSFVDDEDEEERELPSTSFCKALDREAEYDDIDAMASRSLGTAGGVSEPKPPKGTEVLEDNAYERQHAGAAQRSVDQPGPESGIQAMEEDVAVASTGPPGSSQAGQAMTQPSAPDVVDAHQQSQQAAKQPEKRLRFHESIVWKPSDSRPASAAATAAPPPTQAEGSAQQPPQQQSQGSGAPNALGMVMSSGHGRGSREAASRRTARARSYVPDHVKNPQKYRCYTLDEPVVVGGGDTGSGAGEQRELEKAARDALAVATAKADTSGRPDPTAAAEQRAELPAFGAGIPFRPRASRNMPNGQQQQQQSSKTNVEGRDMPKPAADIAIPDDEEAAEDTMEVDAAMDVHAAAGPAANGTGATAGRPQRKRQYRARQQRGDEEL